MCDRHDEELIDMVESALDSIYESVDADVEDTIEAEKELLLGDDLNIPILDDEEEISDINIDDMTDEELAEIEAEADEYVDDEDESDDIELDEEISDEELVDENYMLII